MSKVRERERFLLKRRPWVRSVLLTVVIVQTFQVLKVTVGEITWKMAETLIGAFLANLAIDSPIGKKDSMEQLQYFTMYCCRHSLMQFS